MHSQHSRRDHHGFDDPPRTLLELIESLPQRPTSPWYDAHWLRDRLSRRVWRRPSIVRDGDAGETKPRWNWPP